MPTREEILRHKTYKDEGFDTEERVWRTIYEDPDDKSVPRKGPIPSDQRHAERTAHRTATLLSHLVAKLEQKGLLTEEEIEDWLFEMVMRA
jgi:hypothetical protein